MPDLFRHPARLVTGMQSIYAIGDLYDGVLKQVEHGAFLLHLRPYIGR